MNWNVAIWVWIVGLSLMGFTLIRLTIFNKPGKESQLDKRFIRVVLLASMLFWSIAVGVSAYFHLSFYLSLLFVFVGLAVVLFVYFVISYQLGLRQNRKKGNL